jgi:DNA-binding Xre family transcriptional regulator
MYPPVIAILTPLNWSSSRLRDSTVAALVNQNGLGMEALKNIWEELLDQICLFLDYKVRTWNITSN